MSQCPKCGAEVAREEKVYTLAETAVLIGTSAEVVEHMLAQHPEHFPIARLRDPELPDEPDELEDQLPGCVFDYTGYSSPPLLRCVRGGCDQEVEVSSRETLADLFLMEKLTGTAKQDGEREQRRRELCGRCRDEADEDAEG